jgi:hypothetical protein
MIGGEKAARICQAPTERLFVDGLSVPPGFASSEPLVLRLVVQAN